MTASDFHKILRSLTDDQETQRTFHLPELAQSLPANPEVLREHLHTLATLDLIVFLDDTETTFSLTQSGRLANLP